MRGEQGKRHFSNICSIQLSSSKLHSVGFPKCKLVRRCDSKEGAVGHVLGWCLQELSEKVPRNLNPGFLALWTCLWVLRICVSACGFI